MIEKLKPITETTPNYLPSSDIVIGVTKTIRYPNTGELMDKINEIIEVINNITR